MKIVCGHIISFHIPPKRLFWPIVMPCAKRWFSMPVTHHYGSSRQDFPGGVRDPRYGAGWMNGHYICGDVRANSCDVRSSEMKVTNWEVQPQAYDAISIFSRKHTSVACRRTYQTIIGLWRRNQTLLLQRRPQSHDHDLRVGRGQMTWLVSSQVLASLTFGVVHQEHATGRYYTGTSTC